MTDKTPTAEQQEIESLRAHNAELLADLKKAKASNKELAAQVEELTGERDEAHAKVKKMTLDKPVAEMLERIALDPDLFALKFGAEYEFVLGADGIEIHDKDGDIPSITPAGEKQARPVTFTHADIVALCDASPHKDSYDRILAGSKASGGGASGAKSARAPVQGDRAAPNPAPVHFGLS